MVFLKGEKQMEFKLKGGLHDGKTLIRHEMDMYVRGYQDLIATLDSLNNRYVITSYKDRTITYYRQSRTAGVLEVIN